MGFVFNPLLATGLDFVLQPETPTPPGDTVFLLDGSNSELAKAIGGETGLYVQIQDDSVSPSIKFSRSRADEGDVQPGDVLGGLQFRGRAGGGGLVGSQVLGGQLYFQVEGALTSNKYPSSFHLSLADTAGVDREMLSITEESVITLGSAVYAGSVHRINGKQEDPAANVITITNAPFAGSGTPEAYLRINVNGTEYVIPLLPGA